MKKTVSFYTLGCKVNQYETNAMEQQFIKNNYEIVENTQKADIYVINTCTVTNMAERKSRQMLRRVKEINPSAVLVVCGCYAQVAKNELEQIQEINIILGINEKNEIVQIVEKYMEEMQRENRLTAAPKGNNSIQINKTEAEPLRKIRRKIRKKRIASVLLAVILVVAAGRIGHYWYYDKENYISWDEANISVKDGKVYSIVNPLGRMKSVLSVDQKNMFYMLSETMWTRKEYPSDVNAENELWNLQDFQNAYERGADESTDETSLPTGIERSLCTLGLPG